MVLCYSRSWHLYFLCDKYKYVNISNLIKTFRAKKILVLKRGENETGEMEILEKWFVTKRVVIPNSHCGENHLVPGG